MKTQRSGVGQVIVVRLNTDDDILLGIRQAVAEHGVTNAVLLGAIGSVNRYHVHVVDSLEVPPRDVFLKGDEPLDILSMNGVVMDGRVHAHISFSGTRLTMGGHLEEGCRVLAFCQVMVMTLPEADLTDWDRIGNGV
jgi:predicted DNA-binding protein with PD1-like motif